MLGVPKPHCKVLNDVESVANGRNVGPIWIPLVPYSTESPVAPSVNEIEPGYTIVP